MSHFPVLLSRLSSAMKAMMGPCEFLSHSDWGSSMDKQVAWQILAGPLAWGLTG